MTPIVHWDSCSNFQVTDDWEIFCSHHKVNPKIMGHTELNYLFFRGAALWVYQLSKNSSNIDEVGGIFHF